MAEPADRPPDRQPRDFAPAAAAPPSGGVSREAARAAFVLGVSRYDDPDIQPLPYAVADARAFFDAMVDPRIGAVDRTRSRLVLDASEAQTQAALAEFLRSCAPDDELIFFVAGHAERLPSDDLLLFTRDTDPLRVQGLRYGHLRKVLNRAGAQRTMTILDTCYAQSASRLKEAFQTRGSVEELPLRPSRGSAVMWACGAADLTVEDRGIGHGVFTGFLLASLREGGSAPVSAAFAEPGEIIAHVRGALERSRWRDTIWPGFRISGEVPLRLARNPRFGVGAATSEPEARSLQVADVSRVLGIGGDVATGAEPARRRLHDLADAVRTGRPVAQAPSRLRETLAAATVDRPDASTSPLRPAGGPVAQILRWRWTGMTETYLTGADLALLGPFLWQVPEYGGDACILQAGDLAGPQASKTALAIGCGYVLLMFVSFGLHPLAPLGLTALYGAGYSWKLVRDRRQRRSADRGLVLVTSSEGFAFAHAMAQPVRAVLWSEVAEIVGDTDSEAHALVVVGVNLHPPASGSAGEVIAFPPGRPRRFRRLPPMRLDLIHPALIWGRHSSDPRWVIERVGGVAAGTDAGPVPPRYLLFGVGAYAHATTLPGPAQDVAVLRGILLEGADLRVALDLDLQAFKAKLMEGLQGAANRTLLVYFAGHALVHDDDLFLALADTRPDDPLGTAFPVTMFLDLLQRAKLRHLVLVLDCCYSGQAGEDLGLDDATEPFARLFEPERDSITILAASRAHDVAWESGGGLFTRNLAAVLRGSQAPVITVGDVRSGLLAAEAGQGQVFQVLTSDVGLATPLAVRGGRSAADLHARVRHEIADARAALERTETRLVAGRTAPADVPALVLHGDPGMLHPRRIAIQLAIVAVVAVPFALEAGRLSAVGAVMLAVTAGYLALRVLYGLAVRRLRAPLTLTITPDGVVRRQGRRVTALSFAEIRAVQQTGLASNNGAPINGLGREVVVTFWAAQDMIRPGLKAGPIFARGRIARAGECWTLPIADIAALLQTLLAAYAAANRNRMLHGADAVPVETRAGLAAIIRQRL